MLQLSAPTFLLWLDFVGPQKQPSSGCVNRDRNGEKCSLGGNYRRRSVTCEQKEHPREKDHGVTIRELPSARVPVAPEHEGEECNRNPAYRLIRSPLSENEEKKGTAEEDRTSE